MTEQPYAAPQPPQPTSSYAEWGDRVLGWLWDVLYVLPAWAVSVLGGIVLIIGAVVEDNGGTGAPWIVAGIALMMGGLTWGIVRWVRNSILRQGRTGQTWGKAKVGIWLVNARTGEVPGAGSCLARWLLHSIINQVIYLDYLWPLWDDRKQTLTDKILDTVVIRPPAT